MRWIIWGSAHFIASIEDEVCEPFLFSMIYLQVIRISQFLQFKTTWKESRDDSITRVWIFQIWYYNTSQSASMKKRKPKPIEKSTQHQKQKWGTVIKEKSFKSDEALPFKNRISSRQNVEFEEVSLTWHHKTETQEHCVYLIVSSQQSKTLTKSMSCHPSELANLN
jgi:hypothetical protein